METDFVSKYPVRVDFKPEDDVRLVRACLSGDERAFTELYQKYSGKLTSFICRIIHDREQAEDLVQNTFLRVHKHLKKFDQTKKFSTWIFTIATNLAKNEVRNHSRSPLVLFSTMMKMTGDNDDTKLPFEDGRSRPDDLYRKRHLRELVYQTVAAMPEHHRKVFVLRHLEGKTYDEISIITGVNLGTVKSRLNRARTAFAAIIEPSLAA